MQPLPKIPRIGVGTLLFRGREILLMQRTGAHGANTWAPAGGHLEFSETPEETAARELFEETSLRADQWMRGPWTNDYFEKEGKHYITIWMIAVDWTGIPSIMEKEKCLQMRFFDFDNLPKSLFLSFENLLYHYSLDDLQRSSSLVKT